MARRPRQTQTAGVLGAPFKQPVLTWPPLDVLLQEKISPGALADLEELLNGYEVDDETLTLPSIAQVGPDVLKNYERPPLDAAIDETLGAYIARRKREQTGKELTA